MARTRIISRKTTMNITLTSHILTHDSSATLACSLVQDVKKKKKKSVGSCKVARTEIDIEPPDVFAGGEKRRIPLLSSHEMYNDVSYTKNSLVIRNLDIVNDVSYLNNALVVRNMDIVNDRSRRKG